MASFEESEEIRKRNQKLLNHIEGYKAEVSRLQRELLLRDAEATELEHELKQERKRLKRKINTMLEIMQCNDPGNARNFGPEKEHE